MTPERLIILPSLVLENIEKVRIGEDGRPRQILRHLCMTIAAGRITVLIGPSGCGKTTLLRLVNRLEDPTAGRILLGSQDIALLDPLKLRQAVGMVPQKTFMFAGTVLENLQHPFLLRKQVPPLPKDPMWSHCLARVDLADEFLLRQAGNLSLGQQQRVGLARALLCQPQVVLLDEPTSALDRPSSYRFARLIRSLCRENNLTLLLVTHDLWFAERVADEVAFLDEGCIIEQGPAMQIFTAPQTEALHNFLMHPSPVGVPL